MDAPRRSGLQRHASLAILSLTLVACSHPLQRKLEGHWFGESVENFDEADVETATGWARGVSFEFKGSTLTVAIPAEAPRTGQYKVASAQKNDFAVSVKRPGGELDRASFRFEGERNLRWLLGDGRSIKLRRE